MKEKVEQLDMKSTKKEMLDVIKLLKDELDEKEKIVLNPQKIREEQKEAEVISNAEKSVSSDVYNNINSLRNEINRELSGICSSIEQEKANFENLSKAISIKRKEIENIYGIEKEAQNLTLLIETQRKHKIDFDKSFETEKQVLDEEIAETRLSWEKEKKSYSETFQEDMVKLEKERKRENDEYNYKLKRDRELEQNKYVDEMEKVKKDIVAKKDEFEIYLKDKNTELLQRENSIEKREEKLSNLEQAVESYPEELKKAIEQAVSDSEKRMSLDFNKNEALLKQTHIGELNVLNVKIAAMEAVIKDQSRQIEKLTLSQENAFEKVQNIANKAVEGASERMRNLTVKMSKNEDA